MEDKVPQDNTRKKVTSTSSTVFTDHIEQCQEAKIVEGVSSVDHSVGMKSGVLGSIEPDSEGKLLNFGNSVEKFGEKMELTSGSVVGVDEFLENDRHPDERTVFESGEKHEVQDVVMESVPLEGNSGSSIAETAEKSMVELSEQQATTTASIYSLKRKAETLEAINEEATSLTSGADELQRKWYCSLCDVSTTSEGTLSHHMQGKKHKTKEAKSKSNGATSITSMDCNSSSNSLQPGSPTNDTSLEGDQTPVAQKWHCSLCQVSTNSEELLKSHLQGKKHKAKEARLGVDQKPGNANGTENVKSEAMTKWYCPLCQVYAASEKNLQEHLQGKKHQAKEGGKNLPKDEQETTCNTIAKMGGKCKKEQEMKGASIEKSSSADQNQAMRGNIRKCWHCKMCNIRTHDEALMDAHRKSNKHRETLRENCGGVIVVSTITVKE